MINKPFRSRFCSWRSFISVVSLGVASAYAGDASATWRECLPSSVFEVAPRSFQVNCINGPTDGSGGVPTWVVYRAGTSSSAENEALANRFQSLVMATILAGRKFRIDAVSDGTLCSGISDCQRANMWGMIPSS